MKKLCLLLLTLSVHFIVAAQGILSGRVTDAETKVPLEGASVFAQNTTAGTITKNDGSFRLQLNRGGYELVISFTGYEPKRINIEASGDKTLDVALSKEDKSLSEVIIKSTNEVADGWEKYGIFFITHFIGATPFADNCSLQNPEALHFYYFKKTDRLKVLATEPLRIANKSLGYNLQYSLDSFVFFYKSGLNSYRGNCLYLPMESDSVQVALWKANREQAYYGSRLHFLRSYYDSTLADDGFTVALLSPKYAALFNRLENPYDTTYYNTDAATGDAELWFPTKATITYTKKAPDTAYLRQYKLPADVKTQLTYVDIADAILIKQNGYFTEQKSWVNGGYWSWKNLADQLPYDYDPL